MTAPDRGNATRAYPVVEPAPAPSLRGEARRPTAREYEVLVAVVSLGGRQAAADALGISVNSVRTYLDHLRAWHGANHTTHLAALVMRDVGDIFGWRRAP